MKIILSIDGLSHKDFCEDYMPNLFNLAKEYKFYPKVRTVFPSVTWAAHSSVVTGVNPENHGVFSNSFIADNLEKHYWEGDVLKKDVIKTETFYDKLKSEGKTIASVCWPLTQGASSIDYNIPEFYSQEEFDEGCTQPFWKELKEKGFPVQKYGLWSNSPLLGEMQDDLTQQIIEYIILNKKPDVLLGHYLFIDTIEHEFGCCCPETYFAMRYVDGLIGRMVSFLKDNDIWEECELLVFSDHGHENFSQIWDIEESLKLNNLSKYVNYADDGGAILWFLNDVNKTYELEEFLNNSSYVEKIFKYRLQQKGQADYISSLKAGITSKKYRNGRMQGSTHGYNPDTCDRMNAIAISIHEKKSVTNINSIKDIYKWVL